MKVITIIIVAFLIAAAAITAVALTSQARPRIGPVANIHGLPFPVGEGSAFVITEKLAHADIYLQKQPLARQLILTITFTPHATILLEVGIRENSFWLSYPKYVLYEKKSDAPVASAPITKTVSIPLTDKIVDRDGSVDLMFFAEPVNQSPAAKATEDAGVLDTTYWQLQELTAQTKFSWPNRNELKDYLKSILTREKPL